jgi:predicted RNA-binding Zn-ribbon protein involved in translation (DUF1610 family)
MGQILASRYLNVNPAKPDGGMEIIPTLVNTLAMSIEPVAPLTSFQKKVQFDLCPSCGNSTVIKAEGCTKCQACGWGEC